MKTKDEYIEILAAELKECSAQIDILSARAENASEEMKHQYAEKLAELRVTQHAAIEKIQELKEASSDVWITIKDTADKIWDELKSGLALAISKFNGGKGDSEDQSKDA